MLGDDWRHDLCTWQTDDQVEHSRTLYIYVYKIVSIERCEGMQSRNVALDHTHWLERFNRGHRERAHVL